VHEIVFSRNFMDEVGAKGFLQSANFNVFKGPSRPKREMEVFAMRRGRDPDRSRVEMFSLAVAACKPRPRASIRVPE
jgi:hypothetical protein